MFRILKILSLLSVLFTAMAFGHLIYGAYINPPIEGVSQRWILLSQFSILVGGLISLILGYIGRVISKRQKIKTDTISLIAIWTGVIIGLFVFLLLFMNKFFPV